MVETHDPNGWDSWKRLVLSKLDRQEKQLDEIHQEHVKLKVAVAVMRRGLAIYLAVAVVVVELIVKLGPVLLHLTPQAGASP